MNDKKIDNSCMLNPTYLSSITIITIFEQVKKGYDFKGNDQGSLWSKDYNHRMKKLKGWYEIMQQF